MKKLTVNDELIWCITGCCSSGKQSAQSEDTHHSQASDDNEASHSDSSSASSRSNSDNKDQKTSQQLDVDHMYSDQSQDGQTNSRTTVIRDIVKVILLTLLLIFI